jgi:hypothetical protein
MNKVKDGFAPIYPRVTVDARRIEISLKRFIDPVEWNGKKGVPVATGKGSNHLITIWKK